MSDKMYLVQCYGDLPLLRPECAQPVAFNELVDAYTWIMKNADDPDPEDDRIVIWEICPEAEPSFKAVAHFSGWHWKNDASDLPGGPLLQMVLPGDTIPLIDLVMLRYQGNDWGQEGEAIGS